MLQEADRFGKGGWTLQQVKKGVVLVHHRANVEAIGFVSVFRPLQVLLQLHDDVQ